MSATARRDDTNPRKAERLDLLLHILVRAYWLFVDLDKSAVRWHSASSLQSAQD
jgi:hypothetical protein